MIVNMIYPLLFDIGLLISIVSHILFHAIGKTALHALQRSQLGSWILLLLREIATVNQVSHFLDKFTKQVFPKFAYIVYCYQL